MNADIYLMARSSAIEQQHRAHDASVTFILSFTDELNQHNSTAHQYRTSLVIDKSAAPAVHPSRT